MDNTLYVGLSRQMTLKREVDLIANNIANSDTKGFKVEALTVRTDPAKPKGSTSPIAFVIDDGVARDFGQGALNQTGAPFDLAIDGQAFFKVQTANGERYTRDGRFTLDAAGQLTTQGGDAVLDEGGGPMTIDPLQGPVTIAQDGSISQGALRLGKVGLARFDDLGSLSKEGDNLYRNTSNQAVQAAPDAMIRQGMLEGSNVKPVLEITRLIEVTRAYESMSRTMDSAADLSKRSIERLGKV